MKNIRDSRAEVAEAALPLLKILRKLYKETGRVHEARIVGYTKHPSLSISERSSPDAPWRSDEITSIELSEYE
jgi:hypothetical protein